MSGDYGLATRRARAARERFLDDLSATKARVAPARLTADLREAAHVKADIAKLRASQVVRDHRLGIAAVVLAALSYSFRRPLAALSRRSWVALNTAWTTWRDRRSNDGE